MSDPFYWKRPAGYPPEQCAEEGWYQWTECGLVYLGKEIRPEYEYEKLLARIAELERALEDCKHRAESWKASHKKLESEIERLRPKWLGIPEQ